MRLEKFDHYNEQICKLFLRNCGLKKLKYGSLTPQELEEINPFYKLFLYLKETNINQQNTINKFLAYRHHYKIIKKADTPDPQKLEWLNTSFS